MRAVLTALASAFVAALLMLAGGLFLRSELAASLARDASATAQAVAQSTRAAFEARERQDGLLLANVCARDVAVERLALELDAGASEQGSADRAAQSLSRALGRPVSVGVRRNDKLEWIGKSEAAPFTRPSLSELEAAEQRSVLLRTADARAFLSRTCARKLRGGTLVLVTSRALDAGFVAELGQSSEAMELSLDNGDGAAMRKGSASAEAVRFDAEGGRTGTALVVRVARHDDERFDLALLLSVLATFLLAGSAGFVVGRRRDRHEQALEAIERAARRVAQGDLSSSIGLELGDRADETFQTFDRMTKELREMRARLAEAEREAAFREVSRRIAHEIKNPLAPIQVAIETLRKAREKQRADFGEIFEESTRAILEEVKRLERIVREFGEFARLPKPRPGELDVGELVRDALPLYVPDDVALELDVASELPRVRADREQLTQVLVNLLTNAVDAARAHASPKLRIAVRLASDGVSFSVEDSGPGVAEADRERVFEPYFTTKHTGTGLGLAIVKRIVVDHDGTIQVRASELGGASFSVTLPLTPDPSRTP